MEWLAWALGVPMIGIVSVHLWGFRRVAVLSGVILILIIAYLFVIVSLNSIPQTSSL